MDFSWFESVLYGVVSGMTDILPVSAQAHRLLLLKFLGKTNDVSLMRLFVHIGILGAVYFHCQPHIIRIFRATRLARVPTRRRKRPLDTKSMMDYSLWKTMLLPVILSLFLYHKVQVLGNKIVWMAVFILINGLILYVPQFFPSSNKDSRTLSRVDGLLMGLGGAVSILPGISGIGAALSVASICGVERSYGLTMALLMDLALCVGLVVIDVMEVVKIGLYGLNFGIVFQCILAGVAGFAGSYLGIRFMRNLAENRDFSIFAYYCWGLSLFTFVMNLMA